VLAGSGAAKSSVTDFTEVDVRNKHCESSIPPPGGLLGFISFTGSPWTPWTSVLLSKAQACTLFLPGTDDLSALVLPAGLFAAQPAIASNSKHNKGRKSFVVIWVKAFYDLYRTKGLGRPAWVAAHAGRLIPRVFYASGFSMLAVVVTTGITMDA